MREGILSQLFFKAFLPLLLNLLYSRRFRGRFILMSSHSSCLDGLEVRCICRSCFCCVFRGSHARRCGREVFCLCIATQDRGIWWVDENDLSGCRKVLSIDSFYCIISGGLLPTFYKLNLIFSSNIPAHFLKLPPFSLLFYPSILWVFNPMCSSTMFFAFQFNRCIFVNIIE